MQFRRAEPTAGGSAAAVAADACFHCGTLNPPHAPWRATIDGRQRTFCCAGCLAIAEVIAGAGLDGFYARRTAFAPAAAAEDARAGADARAAAEWSRCDAIAPASGLARRRADGRTEVSLLLEGMSCGACGWLVERFLGTRPGVREAHVNFASRRARVVIDPAVTTLSGVVAAVRTLGYRAHPYDPARREALARTEWRALLLRTAVALLAMMQVMMFAFPAYLGEDVAAEQQRLLDWAALTLTLPVMLYCAVPFFRGAWRDLSHRRLGMDVPVALALAAAFAASALATLRGAGSTYYDSITMFVALLLVARCVELAARQRAAAALEETAKALPAMARRLRAWPHDRAIDTVPAAVLVPGEVVEVEPGAPVPADGVVLEGETHVEEAWLTGESQPLRRARGDALLAGSLNRDGVVTMRVRAAGDDTRIAAVVRLVEQSAAARPHAVRLADRVAGWFVAALLAVAALTALAWWRIDPAHVLAVTFAVLVVSCPCALSLATPAAIAAATAGLARRGIVVARPDALETLARVSVVAFDKTGTLTLGRLAVDEVVALRELAPVDALRLAAALARGSEHPLARALAAHARAEGVADDGTVATDVRMRSGAGIEGTIHARRWRLGSMEFVAALGGVTPAPAVDVPGDRTLVVLGDAAGVAAVFALADTVREDAPRALAWLRRLWLTPVLLSGDRPSAARRVAAQTGIERVAAPLAPEAKCAHIEALQADGACVAMVGDGVNDAPALARADVAVSLASATPLAQCTADLVLLGERLAALPLAIAHARRTRGIMRQNLAWAIAYNVVAIPAAALGFVTPLVASVGMSLSSLVVVLNAARALAAPRLDEARPMTRSGSEGEGPRASAGVLRCAGPGAAPTPARGVAQLADA